MKARQSVLLDTARNVQAFLDAHTSIIGPTIASARKNFDDAVTQLMTMAVTQSGSIIASKGATARQKALRTALVNNNMKPISTIAKLLLPDAPEIGALVITRKGLAGTQLIASAHGMADAAEKYSDTFTQSGMPDDFVASLRSAADAVTAAGTGRQVALATGSGAVAAMQVQEARVRSLLHVINALVIPKLGTDASLLSQWKAARAIDSKKPITAVPASAPATGTGTSTTGSGSPATGTAAASAPSPVESSPSPATASAAAPASQG
jgi:hypothetical protein